MYYYLPDNFSFNNNDIPYFFAWKLLEFLMGTRETIGVEYSITERQEATWCAFTFARGFGNTCLLIKYIWPFFGFHLAWIHISFQFWR